MAIQQEARPLIIGVGNAFRSDDAVGLAVAKRLKDMSGEEFDVIEQSADGMALIQAWKGYDFVILVDAMHSRDEAGIIRRFEVSDGDELKAMKTVSSHGFGIGEAIELARALGALPSRLVIYGIEGGNFDMGTEMSYEVAQAAKKVVEHILEETKCMSFR